MRDARTVTWLCRAGAGFACGVVGWIAGSSASPATPPMASATSQVASARPLVPSRAPESTVEITDGKVTVHVDRQPLNTFLAELERQAGRALLRTTATATPAVATCETAHSDSDDAATTARLASVANRVMNGAEPDRYQSLIDAQNAGMVSETMLRTLYQTDASPRVRLLAFDYFLAGNPGDIDAQRSALDTARLLPDAVISQDAVRRLEALPGRQQAADDPQRAVLRR